MTDIDVYHRERAPLDKIRAAERRARESACTPSSPPSWRSTRRPPSPTSDYFAFACNDGDESDENAEDVRRRHVDTVGQSIDRLKKRSAPLISEHPPEWRAPAWAAAVALCRANPVGSGKHTESAVHDDAAAPAGQRRLLIATARGNLEEAPHVATYHQERTAPLSPRQQLNPR